MMDEIDDAELNAFVDGRLAEPRRARVAAYLAAHPEQQRRVQDWARQARELRLSLGQDDPAEGRLILARLGPIAARRSASPWRWAATILMALGLGATAGWTAHGDRNPTEIARLGIEAAMAYRVFANDTDRAVEISSDNRAELVARLTQKLGRHVVPPDLSPIGYRLMGGRVLTAMYGPAAMLLYRDASDNRITVYLQPMRLGLPQPMQPMQAHAVEGYTWISRQVGYGVMSEGDRVRLHQAADQVHAETQL